MQIKTKLQIVALLPLLVFGTATAIYLYGNSAIEGLYEQAAVVDIAKQTTMHLVSLTYEYGNTSGERAAQQWQSQYAGLDRLLKRMPALFETPDVQPIAEDIHRRLQTSNIFFSELLAFDSRQSADNTTAPQFSIVRNNMVNRLTLELQSVLTLTDKIHVGIDTSMKRTIRSGSLLTNGIVLGLALILIGLAFWVIWGVNRSLFMLQRGIEMVSGGDLEYRVNLESKDELGAFGRGFDKMTEKLKGLTVSRDTLIKESAARRLVEDALTIREAQLNEAQRIAQLGSWELDLSTNTLVWSEEIFRIFEIDHTAFGATYEAFLDAIHPDDREAVNQAYTNSLETKSLYEVEHRLLMKDGRIKFVHERCKTYFDDTGRPLRSIGTVQDVSERKRVEEEIKQLNAVLEERIAARTEELGKKSVEVEDTQRALMNIVEDLNNKTLELEEVNLKLHEVDLLKSMFIASMSHELRTPLNSIIGFSSILLEEWIGPLNAEQKEKQAIVLRTGKHLLSLINDLIDISKIEAGKLESIPEEFDLFDLITEAVGLSEAESAAKGITLQKEAIHLAMHTDRRRLYQCLVNLLGNAVKFTRAGTITLTATLTADHDRGEGQEMLVLSVRDTGIGIKEEDLPKLFASFVRLPLPEDMQAKGTGLGLYLVKKIATEILGGTVSVTSVYGQGSEFRLTVPVGKERIQESVGRSQ